MKNRIMEEAANNKETSHSHLIISNDLIMNLRKRKNFLGLIEKIKISRT